MVFVRNESLNLERCSFLPPLMLARRERAPTNSTVEPPYPLMGRTRSLAAVVLLSLVASCLSALAFDGPSHYRPPTFRSEEYEVSGAAGGRSTPISHGTTTLGFTFYRPVHSSTTASAAEPYSASNPLRLRSGLLLAVDSRSSISSYVSSSTVQKVLPLSPRLLATVAGGAADCQHLLSLLRRRLSAHASQTQTPFGRPSAELPPSAATALLANALYSRRPRGEAEAERGLSVGTIVAGYEVPPRGRSASSLLFPHVLPPDFVEVDGARVGGDLFPSQELPALYYCDSAGNREAGDDFAVGSGGPYATGCLDASLARCRRRFVAGCRALLGSEEARKGGEEKGRETGDDEGTGRMANVLGLEEAVALAKECILKSTMRDGYSGGVINVYLIEKDDDGEVKWRKIDCEDSR